MKICANCGQNINDNDRFCPNCNAPQPTGSGYQPITPQGVSTGGWFLRMLLLCIPIVNIIMLIVWMLDSSKDQTSRNWAKAQLIWMVIGVVLAIILLIIVTAASIAMFGTMPEGGAASFSYQM